MEAEKKEHLAFSIGFFLILVVFAVTLFRSDTFSKKKTVDSKNITAEKNTASAKYETISPTDLQKRISSKNEKQSIALLDVRSFEAYIEEHIVDSLGVPLDEFPIGQKIDERSQIIVIGQDSSDENISKAVDKLKEEKFKNISVLAGGIDAWKQMLGSTVTYGNPESFVDQSKVAYLDPEQLNEAIKSGAPLYIIDVRSDEDYKKGHITGAINIPFDELEKRRNEVTERKAVIVGTNELQEFQASVQLYDMLMISPFIMRTAMPGWQSKGYELVK